jgi:uncharacterized membrane protein
MLKKLPWIVFASLLVFAFLYVTGTARNLPAMVASHFDADGHPSSFMTRGRYTHLMLGLSVGLPIAMVALLTVVYSRAKDMKLPNRDYWLVPERIAQTRSLLVNYAVWFGCIMVAMACYVHWLELGTHHSVPVHLSNQLAVGGLLAFLLISVGWIFALLGAFRLPRGL